MFHGNIPVAMNVNNEFQSDVGAGLTFASCKQSS